MADLEKRVGSLEQHRDHIYEMLDLMASNQNRLDDALATLADAHIRTQEQFLETDRRMAETDRRIADLVSGIGEFIRKMDQRQN
jgi:hypothetical protein